MEFLKIHVELRWETKKSSSWQDSQDFAGRIERMLRLSMGVDLEATVDPDVEEPEERKRKRKRKKERKLKQRQRRQARGLQQQKPLKKAKKMRLR